MCVQRIVLTLLMAGMLASATSCSQSESSPPARAMTPYVPSADTIARVHWLGEERLGVTASAFFFMRLWQLPASTKLQDQTLAKLSAAPWRLPAGETTANGASAWLRPLLDDIVWNESYLEVHQPANQPAEFVFAIKLNPDRAGIWETNLVSVLKSLTGTGPAASATDPHGWVLKRTDLPNLVELTHAGGWTIVSAAPDNHALLAGVLNWIHHDRLPAVGGGTNDWLEAEVDLQRLAAVLPPSWNLPANLPEISLAINGDGANVLTRGQLTFPEPLRLELAPWTVPANLIPDPLDSFTAVRGLQPWLSSFKILHDLPLAAPPDQLYFWALPGASSQVYFTAPVPEASNQVNRLSEYLMTRSNPWLAARGYVSFDHSPDANGVVWGNMASIQPFLRFADTPAGGVIFGGLLPDTNPGTNTQDNLYARPSLSRLLARLSAQTNLVYYDWELTGSRIQPCFYIDQVVRAISRHSQLPPDSVSLQWLQTIQPRLGNGTTMITGTGTNQLSFVRQSTLGFTGAELQLLADWLESPQFPYGLYPLRTPPPTQP